MSRQLLVMLALVLGVVSVRAAGAQQLSARFEITSVGDSTFSFATGNQRWVTPRTRGIVVDPARRDALVARFRILRMDEGTVTALVTGQTTRVTDQHFVVMSAPPPPRWYARNSFWGGAAAGAIVGTLLGSALR